VYPSTPRNVIHGIGNQHMNGGLKDATNPDVPGMQEWEGYKLRNLDSTRESF
jgi:hypothetical protein